MICLNVGGVGPRIGVSNNVTPKRICLPKIGVGPIAGPSGQIIIYPSDTGAVSYPGGTGLIVYP